MTKRHQFQAVYVYRYNPNEAAAMIAPRKAGKRIGFALCILSSAAMLAAIASATVFVRAALTDACQVEG